MRILIALVLLLAAPVQAQQLANRLFGAHGYGSLQSPAPIGSYAKGCAAGLVRLPETGPTWQAMRLSRNRHWGHPFLMEYV